MVVRCVRSVDTQRSALERLSRPAPVWLSIAAGCASGDSAWGNPYAGG